MPDYYIFKAPTCACGDDAVRIPDARAEEGINEKAHWCTGTLRMTDGFGNPRCVWFICFFILDSNNANNQKFRPMRRYVYNPYTYKQLRTMLRGLVDPYLECISMRGQVGAAPDDSENIEDLLEGENCAKIRPLVGTLDSQQVSAIAVLERCKSNYQQKQWDVGAFLLYDSDRVGQLITGTASVLPPSMPKGDEVGQCLLRADKNRESNLACMSEYLSDKYIKEGTSSTTFWRYEKVTSPKNSSRSPQTASSSDDTDACIVFSGPAKKNDSSLTTAEFRRCAHDYEDSGCIIPHMVWSSSSKNKVPVATLHTIDETHPQDREQVANRLFAEARDMAMKALTKLENFTDANLEVVLFSGEGDSLHQIFDCIVMGPYSRVDFWDRWVYVCALIVSKQVCRSVHRVSLLFQKCFIVSPLSTCLVFRIHRTSCRSEAMTSKLP